MSPREQGSSRLNQRDARLVSYHNLVCNSDRKVDHMDIDLYDKAAIMSKDTMYSFDREWGD